LQLLHHREVIEVSRTSSPSELACAESARRTGAPRSCDRIRIQTLGATVCAPVFSTTKRFMVHGLHSLGDRVLGADVLGNEVKHVTDRQLLGHTVPGAVRGPECRVCPRPATPRARVTAPRRSRSASWCR
jgi:hypothetical protein